MATIPRPAPRKGAVIELDEEDFKGEIIIHKNLTQDVLLTTEDKMKLALIEYKDILGSRAEWIGAGTLALSFLSSLLLTNFKDIGPLKAGTWQALYFLFFILALLRFINIVYKMIVNRKKANPDYIIGQIKQERRGDGEGTP